MITDRFHWQRGILCGLLWAVGSTLVDWLVQPVSGLTWREMISYLGAAGLANLAGGLVWALGMEWPLGHRHPGAMYCLQLPLAVPVSVGFGRVAPLLLFPQSSSLGRLMAHIPLLDVTCYLTWKNMLFGGLYVLGFNFTYRTLELRHRLVDLRLRCDESDMQLHEIRLEAHRKQIQPSTLLTSLEALKLRYSVDVTAANHLFDDLVGFLRLVMPGLRGAASSLSSELAVIAAYGRLQNTLAAGTPRWRIDIAPLGIEKVMRPLGLLAVLEQLDRQVPVGIPINISSVSTLDGIALRIEMKTRMADADISAMLHELMPTWGRDAVLTSDSLHLFVLELRLPVRALCDSAVYIANTSPLEA